MINIVNVTYGTICDVQDKLYLFYCFLIVYIISEFNYFVQMNHYKWPSNQMHSIISMEH